MTTRRSLSPMRRLAVFEKHAGRCHLCEQKIQVGEKWEVEHRRALALLGADDESNMAPAHVKCHAVKTKADNASWTKAKRAKAKSLGIRSTRSVIPGSKASKFKKHVDGRVTIR